MKNNNLSPLTLSLSIVAIGLSIFSLYKVGGFDFMKSKTEVKVESVGTETQKPKDDFTKQVYAVIDAYVAEKQSEGQEPPQPTGPVDVNLDDDAIKGDKDAPVTILEFTDYQCPYCERYFTEAYGQIMKNYVDTGKVKYVVRDFPLPFHENALPAANSAECLREQTDDETFFKYHDLLFQNQSTLSVENYKKWATDFKVDQAKFDSCVDENKFKDEIEADLAEGQSYGVQGTPAFFINGMPLSGAQPYAAFEAAIDQALIDAEKK